VSSTGPVINRQGELVAAVFKTNENLDVTHFFGYDYNTGT
jgi:hypothetical protein